MQRIFGGLVVARLPLDPIATIAVAAHFTLAKRTTNRPEALAVTDLRLVPVETTTRSPDLKPRPLIVSGCMFMTVSVARVPTGATFPSCAAPPRPNVISTTSKPISITTPEVYD